jgi:hypothetical protein
MGEMRNWYNIFVGKLERNRHLWRPRCRWDDNIKSVVGDVGREVVDWINLTQDRDQWQAPVNTVMNLRVP